jgi:uncharacterized membrane protein
MLVGLPVTLYLVTLASFAAYAQGADGLWFRVAVYANIAGVITALIAAIPGFIDWAFGVPAGTPAKATGLVHMAVHVVALLIFAFNAWIHWDDRFAQQPSASVALMLSGLGVVLTLVGGFLGATLVQKHHVGVDLTPEQERYEPRASPRSDRHKPIPGASHGQQVS